LKTVYISYFIFLFYIFPIGASSNTVSDYDKLCSIITETRQNKEFSALTLTAQSIELTNKITSSFPESAQIMSVFSVLKAVDPQEKYTIFKQAAEESLSKPWDCPAYKEFNDILIKSKK